MNSRENRPERLEPLRPQERHLDTGPKRDDGGAGYERLARRPHTRGFDDVIDSDRADRIEGMFQDMPNFYD